MRLTPATFWAKAAPTALLAAPLLFAVHAASAQTTVYSNNFSSNANGFSSAVLSTTPGTASHAADGFLGEFSGSGPQTLSLTGLAAHTQTTLSFDFYAIRSLDGNAQFGGGAGDSFTVTANQSGGVTATLLSTNFANYPGNTQAFGGSNGAGGYLQTGAFAVQTGAAEVNTLGYSFGGSPMDSVYHLTFTFADASPNLSFTFTDGLNEGAGNESYGLDNVVVTTNATTSAAAPEPGSIALLTPGFLTGLLLVRRRARRK